MSVRVPSTLIRRLAHTEVGQRLAAAELRSEHDVGAGRRAEPGWVAAVLPVRVRRRRDSPPRGPHVVVRQAWPRRQPEQGERIAADRGVAAVGWSCGPPSRRQPQSCRTPNASSSTSLTSGRAETPDASAAAVGVLAGDPDVPPGAAASARGIGPQAGPRELPAAGLPSARMQPAPAPAAVAITGSGIVGGSPDGPTSASDPASPLTPPVAPHLARRRRPGRPQRSRPNPGPIAACFPVSRLICRNVTPPR